MLTCSSTTHTECIVAFLLQQWLLKLATLLHVHCVSCYVLVYTWLIQKEVFSIVTVCYILYVQNLVNKWKYQ